MGDSDRQLDEPLSPQELDPVTSADAAVLDDPQTQLEYAQLYRQQITRLSCYGCGDEPL